MAKNNQIVIENFLKMNPQVPQYSQRNQNYLIAGANPIAYLTEGGQEDQLAPLQASIDWANITPVPIDGYSQTNKDTEVTLYAGTTAYYGQSFIGNGRTLGLAMVYLKAVIGGGGGIAYMQVYSHSGTFGTSSVPGTLLATSGGVSLAAIPATFSLVSFTFSGANQIVLSNATNYVVVIKFYDGDNADYIVVGTDHSSPTAHGNGSYSSDGSAWTATSDDMCFYVYSTSISGTVLDGNIVHMIPSVGNNSFTNYIVTDTTRVYGISPTTVTDLGYPNASAAHAGSYLAIGGNYLWFSDAADGSLRKMLLTSNTTGGWTAVTAAPGSLTIAVGVHIMEPFLDFIAVRDGTASYTNGGLILKLDTSSAALSTTPVLNIGNGFGIMQMRNYNDKYLAIAGGKTTAGGVTNGYPQNYIFLWDGISNRYNYSVKIPGQFIDMKVVDGVLYVAVQVSYNKTCVYKLVNTYLRKVFTTQISTIRGLVFAPVPCSLFDFRNYLGVHLTTNSDLTEPIMIQGQDEMGDIEFIHSSGRIFDQFCPGYDGNLFVNEYVTGGKSVLYYLPATGTYQQLLYKSQWIPVKNLQAIDIYHDAPPTSGTDAISVTIDGQGEDILNGSSTTALSSITSTTYLTKKRTRLDVKGFTGNQLRITLSTVNSTWRPKINAIVAISK